VSKRRLVLVLPKDVPYIWHTAKPMIEVALHDEWMTAEKVLADILAKKNHLWIGLEEGDDKIHMALVTEFVGHQILYINTWATATGYNFDEWYPLITTVDEFGRQNGCTTIEAAVRPGLAKKLKWDYQHTVCTRSIK